jgi:putative ABC transport system permease protein
VSAPDSRRGLPARRRGSSRRALVGASALLLRRRAARDAPLLVGWVALLCLAAVLAVTAPRLVLDTVDGGAREAVAEAGSAADVIVRARIGDPSVSSDFSTLADVVELARVLPENLPDGLARAAGAPTISVISPDVRLTRAEPDPEAARVEAQFGLLGADQEPGLRLLEGALPADTGNETEIEVVVSREGADVAALAVGTVLNANLPVAEPDEPPTVVTVRVVGIVASATPLSATACASEWCDLPSVWAPETEESRAGGSVAKLTVLTAAEGITAAQQLFFDPLLASVRLPVHAERFTARLVETVIGETDSLEANAAPLTAGSGVAVDVRTDFADALRGYSDRAAASVAQMTLMIAGLFGALAAVMLLVAGLIVGRRAADLALERARGSSLGAVAVRGLAESAVLALVGAGLGVGIAVLVAPGPLTDPVPLGVVGAVAVLALPARALLLSREAWNGRRQPANRRDRNQLVTRSRLRRLVLEASVVLLAVAALAALRSRGLVDARIDGTDPLLAAAPLLLAAAVTLVVLRVQPLAVRAVSSVAARSRGAVGVLAAAHAGRAVAVVPLLALTISVALVVGGSLLVQTVRDGQSDASWQRVGAAARVTGVFDADVADRIAAAPGVTAASAQVVTRGVGFDSGAASALGTLVVVDTGYAELARQLPAGVTPDDATLKALADAPADSNALPVVVNERLASRVDIDELVMVFDDQRIAVRVVATFDGGPSGYLSGPFVYTGLADFRARLPEAPPADTLLVMGDGASAAARSVDGATEIVTRAEWLDERRNQVLVQGVDRMTRLSVAAVALLAAIALVTTVAGGGRSRSRSLSLLRTLGVQRGFGWVLALAELAPLVIAALVGGAAAGVVILVASGPALGLRILTGGTGEPVLRVDPLTVVLVVAGSLVLCAVAIVADVLAHRRDRPGEVLRVGETT